MWFWGYMSCGSRLRLTTKGIVKLFENDCSAVDVSALGDGIYWLTDVFHAAAAAAISPQTAKRSIISVRHRGALIN